MADTIGAAMAGISVGFKRSRLRTAARSLAAVSIAFSLACTSSQSTKRETGNDSHTSETIEASTKSTVAPGSPESFEAPNFGDIAQPCGPGEARVDPRDAGRGSDRLWIGTITDKGSTIQLRLLKELFDASAAFVEWCNDQGGIEGLQIGLVDLDAQVTGVEAAMTSACSDVFAMVGGGDVLDNLQFSGKPESDFHQCRMIDVPAFTVTPEKANSNGMIAPLPNSVDIRSLTFFSELAAAHPDAVGSPVIVYGELDATKIVRDQISAILTKLPEYGKQKQVAYAIAGADWNVIANQIEAAKPSVIFFVGEPVSLAPMAAAVRAKGLHPLIVGDSNMYDSLVLEGGKAVDGMIARVVSGPFEEADKYPAIKKYLALMNHYRESVPDAKDAALGIQTMSSWLLFIEGVKGCVSTGTGTVTRECVLSAMRNIDVWTGGGLHARTNPSAKKMSECAIGMMVKDGKFVRDFPAIDSPNAVDGYACVKGSVIKLDALTTAYGARAKIDPARPN